jgi:hypothetical protein
MKKLTYKRLIKKGVLVDSKVETQGKKQSFEYKAFAIHPKRCSRVLPRLARFENLKEMISFIKTANYNEKHSYLTLKADHVLLPYPMIINIITKRPLKEGIYEFSFPTGLFAGLTGKYIIKEVDKKCTVFARSHWNGPNTRLPDLVIEVFSQSLTTLAFDKILRKTSS